MSLHTINGQPWPDGTVVTVYPAGAQPAGYEGPPMGVAVETQTVTGGQVTFEGLQDDVPYLAYAAGVTKRFLVSGLRVDSLRTRIERLEAGREEYVSIREFGARKGARDNSAAYVRAAASNERHIYVPEGYGDLDVTIRLLKKQHWFGDLTTMRQATYGRRTFEIQPSAAGSVIEGFVGGFRDAKPVGDQSVTLAAFSAEADTMIAQDAATVRSAFVYNMADDVTTRHLDLENVFTGVRHRSSDRYSTQVWSPVIHDVKLRHHDFGLVVGNAINMRVDEVHGRDTDWSTLNPPHTMYFATFAAAPADSLTANEDATHVDTVSVGGTVSDCTDYGNPHGAGSSYKFENLRGTLLDSLQSTRCARGVEILYGDKVALRGFKAHEAVDDDGTAPDSQQALITVSDSVRCSVEGHDLDMLLVSGVVQDVRGVLFRQATRCYASRGIVRTKYDPADTGSRAQYAVDLCTEVTLDQVGCHVEGREHTPIYLSGSSSCRVLRPRVWKADPSWVSIVRTDLNAGVTSWDTNTVVIDPYALNFTPTTASFTDTGTNNTKLIDTPTHADNPRRSSDVSTLLTGADGISSQTPTINFVVAASAQVLAAGTYTKIRFHVGGTLTAVTDVRLMVANSSRAKLAETDNLITVPPPAGALAINTIADNIPLLSSVTLTRDQVVYLGVGGVGTTFTFLGVSAGSTAASILGTPQRVCASAWAGGTMPTTLATAGSSRVPWIELIP